MDVSEIVPQQVVKSCHVPADECSRASILGSQYFAARRVTTSVYSHHRKSSAHDREPQPYPHCHQLRPSAEIYCRTSVQSPPFCETTKQPPSSLHMIVVLIRSAAPERSSGGNNSKEPGAILSGSVPCALQRTPQLQLVKRYDTTN